MVVPAVLLGAIGYLLYLAPDNKMGWFIANVYLIAGFMYVCIIPHEIGHALAALLVKFNLIQISIGRGKPLYSGLIKDVHIQFNLIPVEGLTVYAPRDKSRLRIKLALVSIAGPLVNLLLAYGVWYFYKSGFENESISGGLAPLTAFFVSNFMLALTNLAPHRINTSWGALKSDGLVIWELLKADAQDLEQALLGYYVGKCAVYNQFGRFPQCIQSAKKGLEEFPDNPHLRNFIGVSLLNSGDLKQALAVFKQILEDSKDDNELERSMLLNNIAYAEVLLNDSSLLAEADEFSARCIEQFPWVLNFRSTRGAVLVATGRVKEGLEYLEDKRFVLETNQNRASVECCLVLAYAALGDKNAALNSLRRAESLDPHSVLIMGTRQAIKDAFGGEQSELSLQTDSKTI